MDNGLVCRWLTGQAKISPKISVYYSKSSNQKKLAETIHQNLLPLMSDCNMAMQDIYTLFIQDDTISDAKKKNLASLYKPASSRLLFLARNYDNSRLSQFAEYRHRSIRSNLLKLLDTGIYHQLFAMLHH